MVDGQYAPIAKGGDSMIIVVPFILNDVDRCAQTTTPFGLEKYRSLELVFSMPFQTNDILSILAFD